MFNRVSYYKYTKITFEGVVEFCQNLHDFRSIRRILKDFISLEISKSSLENVNDFDRNIEYFVQYFEVFGPNFKDFYLNLLNIGSKIIHIG